MDPTCPTCRRTREIVSRHPTSEGAVVYVRCGRGLRVHVEGAVVLEGASCAS